MATKTATKTTTDSKGNALYLLVSETRDRSYGNYFHLTARVVTQRLENSVWTPQGVDDSYSDGLRWSGLEVRCQGDDKSQRTPAQPVYGFDLSYREEYTVDLRLARRLVKTLDLIDKRLAKLTEVRGYARSFGEYLGRIAEVLGCAGIGFQRDQKSASISGQRWRWETIGDGVNAANNAIWRWQQEAVEAEGAVAGEAVAS